MEWIVISFSRESFQHRDWTHISCISCICRQILYPWATNPKRWCCESAALNMPENLENSAVATGLEKSVFIPIPKKGNTKECSNYRTVALISHTSKLMIKILQARLQQYMSHELPDVQAGLRKGRGTRDQIAKICWIFKKARELQKNIYLCFTDYAKAFDCVDHNKLEDSSREGNTRPSDLPLEKSVCRSRSNS